jgi:hypothetical protein
MNGASDTASFVRALKSFGGFSSFHGANGHSNPRNREKPLKKQPNTMIGHSDLVRFFVPRRLRASRFETALRI